MESYKLIFSGQLKEGRDQQTIGRFLCKFLRISESNSEKLFSGRAFALKSKLTKQQADELYSKLDSAGIITKVIRETALQEDITYQETIDKSAAGTQSSAVEDYRTTVGDKVQCKHCGSTLQSQASGEVLKPHVDAPLPHTSETEAPIKNDEKPAAVADIEALKISSWWLERFRLLKQSGAAEMGLKEYFDKGIKALPSSDAKKLTYPLLPMFIALMIGPILYLFKGMYRKGFFLTFVSAVVGIIITIIAELFGAEVKPIFMSLFGMIIVGQIYIYDYFRYKVLGDTFWTEFPSWMGKPATLAVSWVALIGFLMLETTMESDVEFVKGSYHGDYRQISIGEALESWKFCSGSEWSTSEDTRGRKFVLFKCSVKPEQLIAAIRENDGFNQREPLTGNEPFMKITEARFEMHWLINHDDTFSEGTPSLHYKWENGYDGGIEVPPFVMLASDIYSNRRYFVTLNFGQNAKVLYRNAESRGIPKQE